MKHLKLLILGCFLGLINQLTAQTQNKDTTLYKIVLKDGMAFTGYIIDKDSVNFRFATLSQTKLEISQQNIASISVIKKESKVNWPANPNPTRYLFGPTAFQLKKGEGYYHNTFIFLNSMNYGMNDYFSIGGGIELISTLVTLANGEFSPILIFTPKAAVPVSDNVRIGGGIIYASMLDFRTFESNGVGIAYGIGTVGSEDTNFSLGLGSGFANNSFQTKPFITLSGTTRIAKSLALVSENWMIPNNSGYWNVYSGGIRLFSDKISADIAILTNKDLRDIFSIGIPYIDFMYKF